MGIQAGVRLGYQIQWLKGMTGLMVSLLVIGSAADVGLAQEVLDDLELQVTETIEVPPTLDEAFEDAFYQNDQDFFEDTRLPRALTWIFGPYPDREMVRDGEEVHELYEDALAQQTSSDLLIRTPDLDTPYTSSLLTEPIYVAEPIPDAPPSIVVPPQSAPAARPAPARSVPALW